MTQEWAIEHTFGNTSQLTLGIKKAGSAHVRLEKNDKAMILWISDIQFSKRCGYGGMGEKVKLRKKEPQKRQVLLIWNGGLNT